MKQTRQDPFSSEVRRSNWVGSSRRDDLFRGHLRGQGGANGFGEAERDARGLSGPTHEVVGHAADGGIVPVEEGGYGGALEKARGFLAQEEQGDVELGGGGSLGDLREDGVELRGGLADGKGFFRGRPVGGNNKSTDNGGADALSDPEQPVTTKRDPRFIFSPNHFFLAEISKRLM